MLRKIGKIALIVALMVGFCWASDALASSDVFVVAATKLGNVFKNVRTIVFVLGAFTLVGFAIAAIFGKLEWKKVAILAVGLALLAVATKVIDYVVSSSKAGTAYTTFTTNAPDALNNDENF